MKKEKKNILDKLKETRLGIFFRNVFGNGIAFNSSTPTDNINDATEETFRKSYASITKFASSFDSNRKIARGNSAHLTQPGYTHEGIPNPDIEGPGYDRDSEK